MIGFDWAGVMNVLVGTLLLTSEEPSGQGRRFLVYGDRERVLLAVRQRGGISDFDAQFSRVFPIEHYWNNTQRTVCKERKMTGLPVMLYAVLLSALGAAIIFAAYRGCLKVVEWREHD